MSMWSSRWGKDGVGIFLFLLIAACGCRRSSEEPSTSPAHVPARPATEATGPESKAGQPPATVPSPTPPAEPSGSLSPTFSSHASVLASKELGMMVTGKGAGEPGRSLEVLEQQVLSFLPQIQDLYDQEREQDPGLMGSLDVSLTIAPEGGVSDIRFPQRRVSNERLIPVVFDRMRAWSFPPAEEKTQLRFRLLFLPPGVDQASILTWEKQLGGRAVEERSEERRVATALPPVTKRPSAQRAPAESPPPRATETTRASVVGWYRVTSPTVLRAAPRDSSGVVARLRPGTRVRVVGTEGAEWLEVRSVSNRPPGFLYRGDARPEGDKRGRQR